MNDLTIGKQLRYTNSVREREVAIMAFLGWFIRYLIIALILAAVAGLGIFTGKKLRTRKDEKTAGGHPSAE
jgi:hypothetical protein